MMLSVEMFGLGVNSMIIVGSFLLVILMSILIMVVMPVVLVLMTFYLGIL